jgi:hypothetical protein
LPYGVWIERKLKSCKFGAKCMLHAHDIDAIERGQYDFYKPYLFPLSSMTEEQKNEIMDLEWSFDNDNSRICNILECFGTYRAYVDHTCCSELIDWCIKNHFDYRGLIPMGLAKDATGKNIY